MRANERFRNQPPSFWANVRTISEELGYASKKGVKVHRLADMVSAMKSLGLGSAHLVVDGKPTKLGADLEAYFQYRAEILNSYVEPRLMTGEQAEELFKNLCAKLQPECPLPMNKQKGEKKKPAFLTGIVNMLVEASAKGIPVDYDPRQLTTVTHNNAPLRTLSRRVDGAFPTAVNPIAIWEIKEYYHTTSFGSRIADGVYETQLDGIELEELERVEKFPIEHLLVVDAHRTWWKDGKSYLCRIIDMLHMGLVDEVLFGREVVERMPEIVAHWVEQYHERERAKAKGALPS
jgi:hypothetical protein